jgi:serine/threonine protein kinase
MEYIEGITLEEAVAGAGRGDIPLSRIRRWIVQICEVLEYLHGRTPPVIFRDLKPANIMLTPDDNVKLIDFGIARLFLEGKEKDTMIIGTPGYAAPEQYGRSQTGVRSDIYSLGATMYFLLTRKDPGFSPLNFKVPSSINQDLPEMWDALIMRSLLLDPERRFASVREIREILEGRATAMLAGATVPAAVTPQPEVSPASLSFNLKERTQTMSDRIVISNSSGGVLRGSLVSDRPWLYLRPAHFRGNRQEVEVTVDLYGERRSWDYTATVTLRAEDAVVDVPVSVKVKRPWFLASVPRRLVSGLLVGESMIPYAGLPLAMFSYYICDRAERGRQSLFLSLAGFIGLMSSALAWYFKIL